MARINARTKAPSPWLVTFSDVVMLLMVFFILLLSMSSLDRKAVSSISVAGRGFSSLDLGLGADEAGLVREAAALLVDERGILVQKDRIFDLVFAGSRLPSGLQAADARKMIDLERRPQGVAFTFADDVLFRPGSASLSPDGQKLLDLVTPVIQSVEADIFLCAGADVGQDENAKKNLALLAYLHGKGIDQRRVSLGISGGATTPGTEIVLKTAVARY